MNQSKITFIIPSVGRSTLARSIGSLLSQTNPNWKAIVVFDGVKNNINIEDDRITYLEINKVGVKNNAGRVRNIGISRAETDWVAFLDDDDTISYNYVNRFEEEIKLNSNAECIIFRMQTGKMILPMQNDNNFHVGRVGISFAMKASLPERFSPSDTEDYNLLNLMRSNKRKIIISPYINYFVRSLPIESSNNQNYPRITINF